MRLIHFIQQANVQQAGEKKKLSFQILKLPLRTVYCLPICLLSLLTHITHIAKTNELESWLLEKGYIEQMVSKQFDGLVSILEKVFWKAKSDSNQKKQTFNYHLLSGFSKLMKHFSKNYIILLTSDKEHKKIFQDIPVARSCNCNYQTLK